jgi:1-aminocyclopropane-1-carboxylate deaminase/D-cysteine desulfhydrase-like pyridoxal-dependent ACC family enzyme
LLDPVYTGKMMYGLFELIDKGHFPKGSKIIALHTGGLQGWAGIKDRYVNKTQYDFSFINS